MLLRLRLAFLVLSVLGALAVNAQNFPTQTPPDYKVSLPEHYQKNLAKISKEKIETRDAERFAQDIAYSRKQAMGYGRIYIGWNEMEQYTNQVLRKILPDSLKNAPEIKVFITRSAEENAFAMPDGSIYLNIGLMAELENEATLAYLLGHELTHYLQEHGKNKYLESLKRQTKLVRLIPAAAQNMYDKEIKYSQNHETEADKLGFYLAHNAGYDASGMISLVVHMVNRDKEQQLQEKAKYEAKLTSDDTHPTALARLKQAEELKTATIASRKNNLYLVSQQKFNLLREQATQEKLRLLFKKNDLIPAIEYAYVAHLLQPQNPAYVLALVEGIRKNIYVSPTEAKKGFLTSHLRNKYFQRKQGITKNISFLVQDSVKLAALTNTNPEIKNVSYQTYEQAFLYFAKKAEDLKQPEVYLQYALYYAADIKKRESYLNQYLGAGTVKYTEYAKALLQNKLELPETGRKILLVNDIAYTKDYLYGFRNNWLESEQKQAAHLQLFNSYIKEKKLDREVSFMSDYFGSHLPEAVTLFDISSFYSLLSKDNIGKVHLSIYDPAYWQFFKDNNIAQFEFYKVNTLDRTYKKYRNFFIIPPFTAFYLYAKMYGWNNRYSFDISSLTVAMSEKHYNNWVTYRHYKKRLTDKRLTRQLLAISQNTQQTLDKTKLVALKTKKTKA